VVGCGYGPNHLRLVAGPLVSLASRLGRLQALVKKVSESWILGFRCTCLDVGEMEGAVGYLSEVCVALSL
jgi:hypothetical protein